MGERLGERLNLIQSMLDLHQKSMDNHITIMHELMEVLKYEPPEPRPQHIIITGPTSASALAPLPGTELTIFRMIPAHSRIWAHCLGTNFRFEPTSFVRRFPGCGHYFWYRHHFQMENGFAVCSQCAAEEVIAESEERLASGPPPSSSPPRPPPAGLHRRRARLMPNDPPSGSPYRDVGSGRSVV